MNEQRTLINLRSDSANRDEFSQKKAILAEVYKELQKTTIEGIDNVVPNSNETNSLSKTQRLMTNLRFQKFWKVMILRLTLKQIRANVGKMLSRKKTKSRNF